MSMASDSEFVRHMACEDCGSSDANSEYTDGHTHCFACGATHAANATSDTRAEVTPAGFLKGDYEDLSSRSLDAATCKKFGYTVARDRSGAVVQVATYRDALNKIVAQKVRGRNKAFTIIGDGKNLPLWGQNLWPSNGRRVVVTEGEIDALSVAQATGMTWPVVSLPTGAPNAVKALQAQLEWLEGYEDVVLCFDMDTAGQKAAVECAPMFTPGKCRIAALPMKDANEMLVAKQVKELSNALWNARTYRPDGIVTLDEIESRVLSTPEIGRPYPWAGPTKATFGRRLGEVIGLGAGSGIGKTDAFTQIIAHDVMTLGVTCGVLYLEQSVGETGRRIAGKIGGKPFHIPGVGTPEELRAAWNALKATGKLHLYDNWGAMDWDTIKSKIRYMATSLGCEHIFLDHLTALAAAEDDEKKALEKIMAELAGLAQSLNIIIHYVSHLATPEGRSHEEGGRVMSKHFKGSRAIAFWSHFLWGMERDTQSPGSQTVLRCLKDRFSGQANGRTFGLGYNATTGLLTEEPITGADHGFGDESVHPNRDF